MQNFTYTARDKKTNEKIVGEIEASSESSASKLLADRGLSTLELKSKSSDKSIFFWKNRIPTKQKVIFSRQLSTLVSAGLPLVQSLSSVRDQTANKPLKDVVGHVINEVEAGTSLSESLAKFPEVFDNIYVSLIAAGEVSGTLDKSLERLANQQEKDAAIVSKVRGALIYPAIVLAVLLAVVLFMLTTVLPSVQSLYQDLPNVQLPVVTRILLAASNAVTGYWLIFVILLAGGGYLLRRYLKTEKGKSTADRLKLKLPAIGRLYLKLYMARFARIGGTLVSAGVPMLQMLNTTAEAVGNVHIKKTIENAAEQVKGGKALSDSLAGSDNFTDLVPSMIKIGEQSGSLDVMLSRVADYYENEVDTEIKSISTIIEPVMMIIVGVLALIVVAAVLLPIYNLAGKVSGF